MTLFLELSCSEHAQCQQSHTDSLEGGHYFPGAEAGLGLLDQAGLICCPRPQQGCVAQCRSILPMYT